MICISCFRTGGPGKEQGTNKPPPTRRVLQRSKGDTTRLTTTSQNPSLWHPSWLNKATPPGRTLSQNERLKTTWIKPEPASHVAEMFSWVPPPSCSPPGHPFPVKSLAFSAHASPQTIYF